MPVLVWLEVPIASRYMLKENIYTFEIVFCKIITKCMLYRENSGSKYNYGAHFIWI